MQSLDLPLDDSDLVDEFLQSTHDRICTLEDLVHDAGGAGDFAEFVRQLHSFKGTANSFNLSDLGKLAHRLEDALVGHAAWSGAIATQSRLILTHMHVNLAALS